MALGCGSRWVCGFGCPCGLLCTWVFPMHCECPWHYWNRCAKSMATVSRCDCLYQ